MQPWTPEASIRVITGYYMIIYLQLQSRVISSTGSTWLCIVLACSKLDTGVASTPQQNSLLCLRAIRKSLLVPEKLMSGLFSKTHKSAHISIAIAYGSLL